MKTWLVHSSYLERYIQLAVAFDESQLRVESESFKGFHSLDLKGGIQDARESPPTI